MFGKNKCRYTQDLKTIFLIALLSVIFILIPPLSETSLRIPFALLLIFFIPGYAFISAMFPGNSEISGIERFTLSVGFSIIIMVFDGFLISLTVWKFRPNSITASLVLLTFIFGIIAYLARKRLPEEEQFSFSYKDFIHSLTTTDTCDYNEEDEEICNEDSEDKRFAARNRKKISSVRKTLKEPKKPALKSTDKLSPEITKTLIIAMVLSIIIAGSMFAYAKATREKETFTTLYILGPDGKAENYPENFSTSNPINIIAGIENFEHATENYTLEIILDGNTVNTVEISLDYEDKWEKDLSIAPTQSKQGRQKLELELYKGEVEGQPYRSVHLWVNQVISSEPVQTQEYAVVDFAAITNPSMESNESWIFSTTNDSIASGYYANGSGIYSSQAFVINASYEGALDQYNDHSLEQIIHSNKTADVILSCYVRDTYDKGTVDQDETQSKRIVFNRNVIWNDGMNGNEGWQHLQVPVTLQEGNNTLTFRLLQNRLQKLMPVEMIIDEVTFIPESAISPYRRVDSTVEFELPVSKVLPLPKTSNSKFTVEWNGTDSESGIYYYNIQYSTDGVTWDDWITKTAMTSAEFEGSEGVTYYFRSSSVDNALNEEVTHAYPDTSTTVDTSSPTIELDITPNPTSDVTYLTVESNKALLSVNCIITPRNFGTAELIELETTDNVTWTSKYTIDIQDTYDIEVTGKDYSGNIAYTFGTLYTDETLEELTIDFDPQETSGDVTITIISSTALKEEPTVVVKDRYGHKLEVDFESSEDNEYVYIATTDDDDLDYTIRDGTARVTVTAKTVDSMTLYEEDTFLIDRVDPTIESFSPDDGETVETDSPSIRVSYSDDRAGIDKTEVTLLVNGVDVTDSAEVEYSSIYYLAQGLENGKVEVHLTIIDQAGNTKEEEWEFYVST